MVQGSTSPLDYQLLDDGAARNLTGETVAYVLKDKDGATVSSPASSVPSASTGKVRLTPAAASFTAALSPYTLHWKVTAAGGEIYFYPDGEPIHIEVWAQ